MEKNGNKAKKLRARCDEFAARPVVHQGDSTKIGSEDGLPFAPESFDKILLDAPCSGLGRRPLLRMSMSEKTLKSYIPIQRQLFENVRSFRKFKLDAVRNILAKYFRRSNS